MPTRNETEDCPEHCPEHNYLQKERDQRNEEYFEKFKSLETRLAYVERDGIGRSTFWSIVAVNASLIGFLFLTDIKISDKLTDVRTSYVLRQEFTDWKTERERRLMEVITNIQRELEDKEPKHPGKPEPR